MHLRGILSALPEDLHRHFSLQPIAPFPPDPQNVRPLAFTSESPFLGDHIHLLAEFPAPSSESKPIVPRQEQPQMRLIVARIPPGMGRLQIANTLERLYPHCVGCITIPQSKRGNRNRTRNFALVDLCYKVDVAQVSDAFGPHTKLHVCV